jgi:hypothetical protein
MGQNISKHGNPWMAAPLVFSNLHLSEAMTRVTKVAAVRSRKGQSFAVI